MTIQKLKKKLKKVSPLLIRTLKRAKKGIQTTIKICKKTAKSDVIEPTITVWFFIIRFFGSITLKAGTNFLRNGRVPKISFIKKTSLRALGYLTLYPIFLLILLQLVETFAEVYVLYIKYGLVAYWVSDTIYREIVIGKTPNKKEKVAKIIIQREFDS